MRSFTPFLFCSFSFLSSSSSLSSNSITLLVSDNPSSPAGRGFFPTVTELSSASLCLGNVEFNPDVDPDVDPDAETDSDVDSDSDSDADADADSDFDLDLFRRTFPADTDTGADTGTGTGTCRGVLGFGLQKELELELQYSKDPLLPNHGSLGRRPRGICGRRKRERLEMSNVSGTGTSGF